MRLYMVGWKGVEAQAKIMVVYSTFVDVGSCDMKEIGGRFKEWSSLYIVFLDI